MKKVELNIPDMQSSHCQMRVNNAIKELENVQIEKTEAGKLTLSTTSDSIRNEVINTIEKAGYTVSSEVSENEGSESTCASGCCNN